MDKVLAIYKPRLLENCKTLGFTVLDDNLDKLLKSKYLAYFDEKMLKTPEISELWVPVFNHTVILNQFNYILTYARLDSDGISGYRTLGSYEYVQNLFPNVESSIEVLHKSLNLDLEVRLGQPKYRYEVLPEIVPKLMIVGDSAVGISSCAYIRCAKMTGKISILNSRRLLYPKFETLTEIESSLNVFDDASQMLMMTIHDILSPLSLPSGQRVT